MRCLAFGIMAVGISLAACGGEDEARNGIEVAPATGCQGEGCEESSLEGEPTKSAPGQAPAPAGTDAPDPVAPPAPSTENTCETAFDLGTMAGEAVDFDKDIVTFATQGTCTTWVKLRVEERQSFSTRPMVVRALLVSPPGTKFDLDAYVNPAEDKLECTTPLVSSASTTSNMDELTLTWGDDWFDDDTRTATFRVKSRDGKCAPAGSWSLLLKSARFR